MVSVNRIIREFATAPLYKAATMCKLGFEFETHRYNDNSYNEFECLENNAEYLHDKRDQDISNYLNNAFDSVAFDETLFRIATSYFLGQCVEYTKNNNEFLFTNINTFYMYIGSTYNFTYTNDTFYDEFRNCLIARYKDKQNGKRLFVNLIKCLARELRVFYKIDPKSVNYIRQIRNRATTFCLQASPQFTLDKYINTDRKTKEQFFNLQNLPLHIKRDGSVDGPEITTLDNGVKLSEFHYLASKVLANPFDVDVGCSFHTHFSLSGVKHTYGEQFQLDLYSYLLEHWNEVPKSVQTRWKSTKLNEYFKFQLSTNKYSFVHFHKQGTWEFRCFGNITNLKDADTCAHLVIRAMQYAYKCRMGLEKHLCLYDANTCNIVLSRLLDFVRWVPEKEDGVKTLSAYLRLIRKDNEHIIQRQLLAA